MCVCVYIGILRAALRREVEYVRMRVGRVYVCIDIYKYG